MTDAAKLTILIATLNDRIAGVPSVLLPEVRPDVRYLVSFQYTDNMFVAMLPDVLRQRPDVTVLPFPSTGLAANRNNALRHCTTPLAIISDDDVRYTPERISEVISMFEAAPTMSIAVFDHNKLALRLDTRLPAFDTRFGLGSAYLSCGEEEVFLHQSVKFGLDVRHFPGSLTFTPSSEASTNVQPWSRFDYDKRVRRSYGALQYMLHSTFVGALGAILLRAFGPRRRSQVASATPVEVRTSRTAMLRDMLDGLLYIVRHPLCDQSAEEVPLEFAPIDIFRMP